SHYQHQHGPGLSKYFRKAASSESRMANSNSTTQGITEQKIANGADSPLATRHSLNDVHDVVDLALKNDQVSGSPSEPNRW
ncbi:MAG: hypothetical protein AAB647_03260, partial [Patescibacteria group bacterium]